MQDRHFTVCRHEPGPGRNCYFCRMKTILTLILGATLLLTAAPASAQCSICTKTASQMGHKPAKALNAGIIYLMFAPLAIIGFLGYRWWRNNGQD